MVEIISPNDLASWLRNDSLASDYSLIQIVDFTNELITEEWVTPVTPIPVRVTLLALSVAARAWVNNPSASNLDSTTVSIDDGSTTQRFKSPARFGVFLTSDEVALLNGERRTRSVRLVAYGQV